MGSGFIIYNFLAFIHRIWKVGYFLLARFRNFPNFHTSRNKWNIIRIINVPIIIQVIHAWDSFCISVQRFTWGINIDSIFDIISIKGTLVRCRLCYKLFFLLFLLPFRYLLSLIVTFIYFSICIRNTNTIFFCFNLSNIPIVVRINCSLIVNNQNLSSRKISDKFAGKNQTDCISIFFCCYSLAI